MAGFDWNEFYTVFSTKMKKAYPKCTVGRYVTPKNTQLEYCLKGYELRRKMQDRDMWEYFGTYGLSAVMTAVEHCLAGRKAISKYIDKPNLQDGTRQNRPLTEEEKMREVDKFFAQEEARRINWRRTHKKKTEQQGGDVS